MNELQRTELSPRRSQRSAEGMLLLTTLIWGGTFGSTKLLLGDGLGPMGLVTLRFGLAVLLFALFFNRRIFGNRSLFDRTTLLVGAGLGILLYAGFALQTIGLHTIPASRSGFITALYVVITPFLQIALTRRNPAWNVWLSLPLVTVGLWLLSQVSFTGGEGGMTPGDWLTLGCAITFSLYILLLDRKGGALETIPMTFIQLIVVAVIATVHLLFTEEITFPHRAESWGMLLYLSLLATVFTTWCQSHYQPMTTPSRAAIIFTMEAVFSAIFAFIVLNEKLTFEQYIGGGLIVTGLLLVEGPALRNRRSVPAIATEGRE